MPAVIGLSMVLLGVSHAVEIYCDGRQNGTQCYGALGGTVILQLMTNTSKIHKYKKRILQMVIQAPVSSPQLDLECQSQGETRASCSSEGGDSPQYSWTLDGHILTDAELFSGNNETDSIVLKQGASGLLVCSVRNQVSQASTEKPLSTCPGFTFINCTLPNGTHISQWVFKDNKTLCVESTTTTSTMITPTTMGKETDITVSIKPSTHITAANQTVTSDDPWYIIERENLLVIAGSLSALVVLVVVAVIYCAQKKKQNKKDKGNEDDQDVTYADVRIMQCQRKQRHENLEMEVEYGQVKVSGAPRQAVEPSVDDCVYAKVH
ncbi:hypothetical protein LDENG_00011900 [Lucifuga dentata]|nr:hypothetical protein LDENG_00011900 [Lucifuga dentata]